jgi:hypothetical protein
VLSQAAFSAILYFALVYLVGACAVVTWQIAKRGLGRTDRPDAPEATSRPSSTVTTRPPAEGGGEE